MIGRVCEWLPIDVIGRESVRAAISRAVSAWSAQWFVGREIRVTSFTPAVGEARGDSDGAGWRIHRQCVAVSLPRRAVPRLLEWVLDVRLDPATLTEGDRSVLDAFERRVLEDLIVRVEESLGVDGGLLNPPLAVRDPFGKAGGATVALSDGQGSALLVLAIPLQAALPLCRASLPPRASDPAPLEPFDRAMGAKVLTVEATLGKAELRMADVRDLAPGDVLVLDRRLNEPADLTLQGDDVAFASATLADVDGQIALTLTSLN